MFPHSRGDHFPTGQKQLQPPPDYSSRAVQLRLLVLVGMFMLVVILMIEASKPKNWQWMWGQQAVQDQQQPADAPRPDEPIDTRLPRQPQREPDAPGTITLGERPEASDGEDADGQASAGPLELAHRDGWSRVWQALDSAGKTELSRLLQAGRQQGELSAAEQQDAGRAIEQLDDHWDDYFRQAQRAVEQDPAELSEQEQAQWLEVLEQLETDWQETRQALQAVLQGQPLEDRQQQQLADLQVTFDRLALREVRDNSLLRAAEKEAWFRLLGILEETDEATLKARSSGPVGFLQLFEQPKEYRGQLVTVRGTARLAYRVEAPRNIHGIESYYIFWLQPAGGPNTPIVVYALEVPPGFPTIQDKDREGETTPLEENVEFTGYFFKRWVYQAQDGPNLAPLILAKTPRWEASATGAAPPPTRWTPTLAQFGLAVLLLAVLAIGVSLLAYRQTRQSSAPLHHALADEKQAAQRLNSLSDDEVEPDVGERLRRLAESEDKPSDKHS